MAKIHVMDKALADLIAAGEVVERPASVVKELVENAIDAGATQITVEIRNGGSTYIRVTDNGCGIPKEEMSTAFLRHATSKISTAQDLDAIGTLGFRGEALAAIAAVARVQMLSKPKEQPMGYAYSIECSEPLEEGDAGCGDGTTVVVRDLFFFHPARYKFLKKDVAEGNMAQTVVERQALGHPEISFRFLRDERQVFTTPGDGEPLAVIHTLMPDEASNMLFVRPYGCPGLQVFGYVSRPTACRGSRSSQHFFVNGRWIQSKRLTAALERAYENQRMVGKFPAAVLYLDVALDKVDVNAHPAKTEVRFLQEADLFGCVFRAVGAELMMAADRPELTTAPAKLTPAADMPRASTTPQWGSISRQTTMPQPGNIPQQQNIPQPSDIPQASDISQPSDRPQPTDSTPPADTSQTVIPEGTLIPPNYTALDEHGLPMDPSTGDVLLVFDSPSVAAPTRVFDPISAPPSPSEPSTSPSAPISYPDPPSPPPVSTPSPSLSSPSAPTRPTTQPPTQTTLGVDADGEPWRLVGEVLNTYIIVEQGDKVLFIDKHAAHERMGFDALKSQGYRPMAQALLTPVSLTPRPAERGALLEHAGELEEFGFQLEEWGETGILVRACPDFLDSAHISATLEELANQYLTIGAADPDSQRDALLHTMACKAAMKGGQKNQKEELFVIAKAVMDKKVTHCPHGRPVATELTRQHLERQFGRS